MSSENASETLKKNWATGVTVVLVLMFVVNRVSVLLENKEWRPDFLSGTPRNSAEFKGNSRFNSDQKPRKFDDVTDYHTDSERYRTQMNERVNVKWQVNETQKQALQPVKRNRPDNSISLTSSGYSSSGNSGYGQNGVSNPTGGSYSGQGVTSSSNRTTGSSSTAPIDPCDALLNNPPPLDISLYNGTALQWQQDWDFYEQCLARLRN